MKNAEKTVNRLNQMFEVAEGIMSEIDNDLDLPDNLPLISHQDISPTDEQIEGQSESENAESNVFDNDDDSLYSLQELKGDFIRAKKTLQNIMTIGEKLLEDVDIDFHAMNAKQIDSIANLSKTISSQVRDMIGLYNDLKSLEEKENSPKTEINIENQQNIIQASTMDIIDRLISKENEQKEV